MIQNAKLIGVLADPQDYHDQKFERGTPGFRVSPSSLKAFAHCPQRWKNGYEHPGSKSLRIGSLFDCRLLTPDLFKKRYVIQPATYPAPANHTNVKAKKIAVGHPLPWNYNADCCHAWRLQQETAGFEITTESAVKESDEAIKRLYEDHLIKSFLDDSDRQVLVHAEWHDEDTGLVIPTQCLIDLVPRADTELFKNLGDLKTTRNAAPMPWQRFCFQAGYHIQGAWNLDHYSAATNEDRNTFYFILQENYKPWQTGRRMLSQDFTTLGRKEIQRLMANYAKCLKTCKWPGYDDTDESVQGWSIVSAEPFMEERAMFAPKYVFPDVDEPEEPSAVEESDDIIL